VSERRTSVALPYWLDRPAEEALAIAAAADAAGCTRLWIGEMATFDDAGVSNRS